ncbi:MAG: hypothetical protein HZB13_02170 [Acidobacteria bacterium]|nr:hypothetical protein [Acidobacteriota bacterium]
MSEHKQNPDPTAPGTAVMTENVDYDRREARAGVVAGVSAATVVMLVAMIVGVYWLYTVAFEQVEHDQYTGVASKELLAIQAREDEQLHKYAYIDKEKGLIRLPIDRAMEIVAAEFKAGTVSYNTKSYPVKVELPGGAAAPPQPAVPSPAATQPPAAAHK